MKVLRWMPFSRRTSRINAEAACRRRRLDPQEIFQREDLVSGRRESAQHEVCPMRPVRHQVPVKTRWGTWRKNRSRACRPDESLRSTGRHRRAIQTEPTRDLSKKTRTIDALSSKSASGVPRYDIFEHVFHERRFTMSNNASIHCSQQPEELFVPHMNAI